VFTRVIAYGTQSIAGTLAERRELTLEHAHGWLKHVGLVTPTDEIEGDRDIVLEARSALQEGATRIADEVRNSIDFHAMQVGAEHLEHAVMTGPGIAIPGLSDALAEAIGLPLELGVVKEARAGGFGGNDAGHLAVAAGLTIEEAAA